MSFGETVAVYCDKHMEHTNTLPNNIQESPPYLTENTLLLRYKAQTVNAVGETAAAYCENHMIQIHSMGRLQRFLTLKLAVNTAH
jgi:hypothetical protein